MTAGEHIRRDIAASRSTVDLYWIPLEAGTPVVHLSGRVFETLATLAHRRRRCDLYHAALEVRAPTGRFVIEQAPVPDANGASRRVVASGPVGTRLLGRFRMFRYEVRCWPNGTIPTFPMRRAARCRSRTIRPQRPGSSKWPRPFRSSSGAATKLAPATCGTRTPSSPGSSPAATSTSTIFDHRRAVEHRAGTPESTWLGVQQPRRAETRRDRADQREPGRGQSVQ